MATLATGINCPKCQSETRVIDTTVGAEHVERSRICKDEMCHHVFTTIEDAMGTEHTKLRDPSTPGMPCTNCGGRTTVDQTRRARGQVRRRRQCTDCGNTFKTKERPKR